MKIADIVSFLESIAPPVYQEDYDNSGLITGDKNWDAKGIVCCLDATEEVIKEAISENCNLVVAHHPIVFRGLKKINGKNYVEKAIITAIKNDIAVYAIHTNLDNVLQGVNGKIAQKIGLNNISILSQKKNTLKKLFTFAPVDHADKVRQALFDAGGGNIGKYSECSFNAEGVGTFRAGEGADPYIGKIGEQHKENEIRIEVIFPSYLESALVSALRKSHPYEEVAFDIIELSNNHNGVGSGIVGDLAGSMDEQSFFHHIKNIFGTDVIRHSVFLEKPVKRIAVCGGAGSFLISSAIAAHADVYITADMKYHEFFDADGRLVIADIGHFESEQFTIELLAELLGEKFPTFAILKTAVKTNPVRYY